MPEFNTISSRVTRSQLDGCIMTHKINEGDSLVLNNDFAEIVQKLSYQTKGSPVGR